jgi:replicative DNA helicase
MDLSIVPTLERVPPNSIEAERAVLGAILLNNEVMVHATELLLDTDFYRTGHQEIFQTMTALDAKGVPIDIITIVDALKGRDMLDKAGGAAYISTLTNEVPSVAHARHYADIIRKLALLRNMIWISTEIANDGYQAADEIDAFLERAEKAIFEVAERQVKSSSVVALHDMLTDAFKKIEELHQRKDAITGVPSGFYDLDEKTAGFQKSDLIIIAGRPAMGKTSFVLNIAQYAATHANIPVVFFSLEMSREQLVMRLLSSEARVDSQRLRRGNLRESDWPKLSRAAGVLAETPIFIDDTPAISTSELRAKVRRLYAKHKIGMVVVDYLQLMSASGKYDMREQEISEISRSLKALAKELNVPVVALSQLNRGVESRPDKRPMISDLRESGAIEQDADVIMFVFREEVYKSREKDKEGNEVGVPEDLVGKAEIIIGKQRQGPTGDIILNFEGKYTRFTNREKFRD